MARYLTTTLPYVNAAPHVGFALELVQADMLARAWRAQGEEVFFSTGVDEHGQKIYEAATKNGEAPQEYADRFAEAFKGLARALDVSADAFIRTTDPAHTKAAQEMWRRCEAAGDIYKKSYEGLYCVGHEAFLTEKDLVDGLCPEHGTKPELLKEENYFFKLSKYQDFLLEYVLRPESVIPVWRRGELENFIKAGLEDFSISREKKRLSWGIPVPGDDTQVMYVWFDALTNYLSTLGWPQEEEGNFKKFWEAGTTLQLAGKDQMRFQSLMWQAMLKSAGIKATDSVFYHGFVTSGGKKMSKSLGNVVDPQELIEKYGTDALRYYLLRHVAPFEDSDFTHDSFHEAYTANLANGLGNLVARTMTLAQEHLAHAPPLIEENPALDPAFHELVGTYRFNEAMDLVFKQVATADALMTKREPYKKIKSGDTAEREEARKDIKELVERLAAIAAHLAPAMPRTAAAISSALRANSKPENLFPRIA